MLAAIGALMRPQARGETETVTASRASADVVFVLDVSRSMLAEDAAPNRLARAKAEIGAARRRGSTATASAWSRSPAAPCRSAR